MDIIQYNDYVVFSAEHLPSELSKTGGVYLDPKTGKPCISKNVPVSHRFFWSVHEILCMGGGKKDDINACVQATRYELDLLRGERGDVEFHIEYMKRRVEMLDGVLKINLPILLEENGDDAVKSGSARTALKVMGSINLLLGQLGDKASTLEPDLFQRLEHEHVILSRYWHLVISAQ